MSYAINSEIYFALGLLLFALVVFLFLGFRYPDVIRDFFTRISKIKLSATGIEIERAVDSAGLAVQQKERESPDRDKLRQILQTIPAPGRVLWVDDNPENNVNEISALQLLGLEVDVVKTNDEAELAIQRVPYDLIISDIGRSPPQPPNAGLELPTRLSRVAAKIPPIVYYTGHATSSHSPDGYPVTDRPSQLFNLIRGQLSRNPAD